jgi:D-alanyl-lipoteichoic acid acyltransferase DltB (MBOAT superfamily)
MVFSSWQFLAFAAIVYPLYYGLSHRWQNRMLLAASYVFYGAWDYRFLALLVISTVVDHVVAHRIAGSADQRTRKAWLMLSLGANLGMLAFFKYFNFFIESATAGLGALGLETTQLRLHIVLPVGISFYTFQTLSYTIDVYRRKLEPAPSVLDFALFVAYFPQLVAGPIERATHLLPQILKPRRFNMAMLHEGLWLISWGLFKKAVIANNLAIVVDRTFATGTVATGGEYLIAIYAFAFQIYCDFSGYSDMARGLAALMGIDLMVNFNHPYAATSPRDFWRRWHISLSTWLRDYLYIPLGGNRGTKWQTYRALVLTMLLGGIWHGAKWTFVVWGVYHGVLLAAHRWLTLDRGWSLPDTRAVRVASRVLMFHLVCLGWLFFRADSMAQVGTVLASFAEGGALGSLAVKAIAVLLPVSVALWLGDSARGGEPRPIGPRLAVVGALWLAVALLPPSIGQPFIYFQF